MKRGELWTAAGRQPYTGKPRPVVILQDDRFDATDSITICPLTSDATGAPLFRIAIDPTPGNGLRDRSFVMADKVSTVPRASIRMFIGGLSDEEIVRLNRAVLVFLGFAG